ncbi:MAG: hypothetical protein N2039_13055 [Gemmataceae bacterium]|nr:hypothetical protein [Gemmataceae bacterium]
MNRIATWLFVLWASVAFAQPPANPAVTFETNVKPILRKHCVACHNEERPRGDLDLTSFSGLMTGGVSGKVVIPGKPEESLLYTLAAHLDDPKMPPNKPKIPQREIDTLARWIEGGLLEKPSAAPAKAIGKALPSSNANVSETAGLTRPTPLPRLTPITALATSPNAPLAAVPGLKQVLLLDLTESKPLGALQFPEGEVQAIRFSGDGQWLFVAGGIGGQSGAVVGFEVGSWKRIFTWNDETDAVLTLDITPDRSAIAIGGPSRVVRVISLPEGKVLHNHRKNTDWVTAVTFSPDGLLLAAGDRFGGLYVWEAKSGKEFWNLRGHTKAITGLVWQDDSDRLISASEDGTVRVWDMHSGHEMERWVSHDSGVTAISRASSNEIFSAGRDQRVRLWTAKGDLKAEIGQCTDIITRLASTHDKSKVITGDWSGHLQAWPATGGPSSTLSLPMNDSAPTTAVVVPVPLPSDPPVSTVEAVEPKAAVTAGSNAPPSAPNPAGIVRPADVERKRAALKSVEEALERVKEETARNPGNTALAKAYLQLCEVALALKADVLAAEGAARP